jgi:hypothetical protein
MKPAAAAEPSVPVGFVSSTVNDQGHDIWHFEPAKLAWQQPQSEEARKRHIERRFPVYLATPAAAAEPNKLDRKINARGLLEQLMEQCYANGLEDGRADATPAAAAEPDPAYQYACSLAQAIFDSEYASDPDYASGKVKWGLCDSTAGVLTQIDNMVSGMKRATPAAAAEPAPQQSESQGEAAAIDRVLDDLARCRHQDETREVIRRALYATPGCASSYTYAIGEAAQAYCDSFKHVKPYFPATWRWHELWDRMCAATPAAAAEPDMERQFNRASTLEELNALATPAAAAEVEALAQELERDKWHVSAVTMQRAADMLRDLATPAAAAEPNDAQIEAICCIAYHPSTIAYRQEVRRILALRTGDKP